MKKIFLISLILFFKSSFLFADVFIRDGKEWMSYGNNVYFQNDSVNKINNNIYFNSLMNLSSKDPFGDLCMIQYIQISCSDFKYKIVETIKFKELQCKGKSRKLKQSSNWLDPLEKGSFVKDGENFHQYLCRIKLE